MRLIITLALVVGWLLVAAPPAAAHVELTAASPAQDAAVTGPLTEIRLEFNGPLAAGGEHAIGVFGPGEQRFDSGQVVEVSDRVISTAVGPLPVTGPYTVRWLVIGVDGHPIEGTYAYSYTGPVASPTTSPQPSPTESSELSPT